MDINLPHSSYKNCRLQWAHYSNARPALQIVTEYNEPLLTASVNMPDHLLPPNCIFIKNYSENAGIMEELIRHNILADTKATIQSGFIKVNICVIVDKEQQ